MFIWKTIVSPTWYSLLQWKSEREFEQLAQEKTTVKRKSNDKKKTYVLTFLCEVVIMQQDLNGVYLYLVAFKAHLYEAVPFIVRRWQQNEKNEKKNIWK